ncbi:hypothetical protein [Mycolicibacterium celeriflavum]|uniref:Uncharacterized protein n=1 Tax=Mycolicibacterium celeriflavum TaxID=1249101 RepID=A0A1X0BRJ1_MYCCF|nr:hypothetical protein [Mycolicibacterium celeriflavum]MCV7240005.1 hypothetical protein [Mycolicibacterium celeriflavum]ORA45414.1 hypothetical protein BST21_17665 [Mycolicibacterium celeriflavum]BBY42705.1 hypothetical protein MCEL_10000 [Mycolicibacterium celeriflavum]
MDAPTRSATKLLLAACAAAASWFCFSAVPAGAEPTDFATPGPTTEESNVLPVADVLEGMWSEYVPPDAVSPGPIGSADRFIEQFVPTTTQIRDFFVFLDQFRPLATGR